jgi:hypothetical protein
MKTRKRFRMIVTVSVPAGMSAAAARREVKTLISEQCNYSAEPDDIKALGVKAAPKKG